MLKAVQLSHRGRVRSARLSPTLACPDQESGRGVRAGCSTEGLQAGTSLARVEPASSAPVPAGAVASAPGGPAPIPPPITALPKAAPFALWLRGLPASELGHPAQGSRETRQQQAPGLITNAGSTCVGCHVPPKDISES